MSRKKSTTICFDSEVEHLIDKNIEKIEAETGVKLSRSAYLSSLVKLYGKENDTVCNEE